MEEVIERRKWLFSRRKSKGDSSKLRRRPTLSHFLAECERTRRRESGPTFVNPFGGGGQSDTPSSKLSANFEDVNFRLQQRYWGRIHRKTPTPSPSLESGSSGEDDEEEEDEEDEGENLIEEEEDEGGGGNFERKTKREKGKRREEDEEKEQLWDELEDENELLGMHRRTRSLRRRERPMSTGALPDQVGKLKRGK